MTKRELDEFVLLWARWGMERMIEDHGSMHQQAIIRDLKGNAVVIVIADDVLHGKKMRDMLTVFATSRGGADAFVILSDSRMKGGLTAQESRKISDDAARGKYSIAEDPRNQEAVIVVGRSREHTAFVCMPYSRETGPEGDIIHFEYPEPRIDAELQGVQTSMIPNIWERVN